MHQENFDPESSVKFPLSKTRMEELQSDIQAPLQLLANMLPLEDCIVSGCANAGDPGYALLGLSDGNNGTVYEVLEVRASSGGTNIYLNLQTSPVYALNGDNENVLVRTLPVEHRVSGRGELEYRVFGPIFYLKKKKKIQSH